MYYEEHGCPDGEPLVLLHGFASSGVDAFGHLLPQLGKRYRIYLPDLRGHGRTTNPGGEISHSELARDTSEFTRSLGLIRAHFCGHSTGGMHLLFLALEDPELIQSLTLASATYTFDDHVKVIARKVRASASAEWIGNISAIHEETHGVGYADTILDLWVESVMRPGELPFTPDDLSRVACPTLIVHGDRDTYFPIHVPITMHGAIPNSELCILPNCNHVIVLESPSLFTTSLLEFLARYPFPD